MDNYCPYFSSELVSFSRTSQKAVDGMLFSSSMKRIIQFFFLSHIFGLAFAIPFAELTRGLANTNVTAIAIDEVRREYVAYTADGSLHARYPMESSQEVALAERGAASVTCSPLSVQDAQTLPGWARVFDYAKSHWGDGFKVVTNPQEYPDKPAQACVQPDVVQISPDGKKNFTCQSTTENLQSALSGTNATVKLSFTVGGTSTAHLTVKHASAIGGRVSFGVQLKFNLGLFGIELGSEGFAEASFVNEQGNGFETALTNTFVQDLWLISPNNGKCTSSVVAKSCSVSSNGEVQIIAKGWVWFHYPSPVAEKQKRGLEGRSLMTRAADKHYKWAVNLEQVLPNAKDRSSSMQFIGNVEAKFSADYAGSCTL